MSRPRGSKYYDVDSLLILRAFEELRRVNEPPTSAVRRVVRECWEGNPDFVCAISELLPRSNLEVRTRAMSEGAVEVPNGRIVFVGQKGSGETRGAWLFVPKPSSIRRLLGGCEKAIVARVLRRLRPELLRSRGKVIARMPPAFSAPYLEFDSRRGRRRPAI